MPGYRNSLLARTSLAFCTVLAAPPALAQVSFGADTSPVDGLGSYGDLSAALNISPDEINDLYSGSVDEFNTNGEVHQDLQVEYQPTVGNSGMDAALLSKEFHEWVTTTVEPDAGWTNLVDPNVDPDPSMNPIRNPEALKRFWDIAPYMIVEPDGSSRVMRYPPEGAVAYMRAPTDLDWNGGLEGDLTCFRPEIVDPDTIAAQINAARVLTTLVAGLPGALERVNDSQVAAWRLERCSIDAGSTHVRHCTGLLEPTGQAVWTAAHCVTNADTGLVEESVRNIQLGESRPCSADTAFRAVSLLGLASDDFIIPEGFMQPCERVERLADDVVRVSLAAPLQVVPADGKIVAPWRWPDDNELDDLMIEGRRVYGTGFLQTAVLYDLMGGRIMPMAYCLVTLAGRLGYIPKQSTQEEIDSIVDRLRKDIPADAITYQGYGCTSMDTMNGSSGGPVFALTDDTSSLVLIGLISAASWTNFDRECQTTEKTPLQDQCGATPVPGFNLFSVLPTVNAWVQN